MNAQRIAVIGIIVFAIVYVLFAVRGGMRHGAERSTATPTPSPTPLALRFDSWALAPAFIKVQPQLPPSLAPGAIAAAAVPQSKQPYRLARFTVSQGSITVQHAHANDPNDTSSPESVTPNAPVTVVLPSAASVITVQCASLIPCVLVTR